MCSKVIIKRKGLEPLVVELDRLEPVMLRLCMGDSVKADRVVSWVKAGMMATFNYTTTAQLVA